MIIEDLQKHPNRTRLEEEFIQKGARSVFIAPLYYQDKLLGTLALYSPNAGDLSAMKTMKLWEILPLFSIALNRGMEELDHRVQGLIKEKCTAIHPSVEWRFQRAALNFIEKLEDDPGVDHSATLRFEPCDQRVDVDLIDLGQVTHQL